MMVRFYDNGGAHLHDCAMHATVWGACTESKLDGVLGEMRSSYVMVQQIQRW